MAHPLDILRAPAPRGRGPRLGNRSRPQQRLSGQAPRQRRQSKVGRAGDLAQAIAAFNAAHPIPELLEEAGVELHEQGREWHTLDGCPLPGCPSENDAFRVHIDRTPNDPRGPQWVCRKCGRGGDTLHLAMWLAGVDPSVKGSKARFLRERGDLDTHPRSRDSRPHPKKPAPNTPKTLPKAHPKAEPQERRRAAPPPVAIAPQAARRGPPKSGSPAPDDSEPADPLRWYREDVQAALGRKPTPEEIEALEERAAILEFDAGLPRQRAEQAAVVAVSRILVTGS